MNAASAAHALGIVVPGITGRMGSLIANAAALDKRHRLLGGTVRPEKVSDMQGLGDVLGHPEDDLVVQGDLAGVLQPLTERDARVVVVDFTLPGAFDQNLDAARSAGTPLVVGTTGLSDDQLEKVEVAAETIPILVAANTSLGANLLFHLTRVVAQTLKEVEMEIVEVHHRHKRDAPSGTALRLAEAIVQARAPERENQIVTKRSGEAPRKASEIGVFGLRGGNVVGDHTVHAFLEEEKLELSHRVSNRGVFAEGALAAARFLADQKPGRYTMGQVLGL
jgi:4-hydroxy-tetrahydrodipicolinate reductase